VQRAVQIYAAVQFIVIGLSHILQRRAWAEFFIHLRSLGRTGVFLNGFLSLMFGSIIVAFHNVWTGLPVVLTVIGWAQIVKAFVSFVFPEIGARGINRVSVERDWEFAVGGVMFLALAALMLVIIWRGGA
jgi:hypothetical protein